MGSTELSDDEIEALLQGDNDSTGGSPASQNNQTNQLDQRNQFVEDGDSKGVKKKVQKVSFGEIGEGEEVSGDGSNLELLMDVPLEVSVEIGRTQKNVQEVLALNIGSVIELNKLSGEPVDLLVNGKVIAKAEVVIIDENFGIRITEIVKPKNRVTFN